MSYPSAPRFYQIDVVDQVGRAYRAVFSNLQLVLEMALLPYLIVLGAELIARLLIPAGIFGGIVAALIQAAAFLIFGAVFIVRWHRFVLLGESVGGGLIPPGWTEFIIAGIKIGVVMFVGWLAMLLIAMLPPHLVTIPLSGLGGVALTLVALRVSLIFPAAAIGRPTGLQTAWHWIDGNFWRLFACAFACYLPFVIVLMVLGSLAWMALIGIIFSALRLAVSFIGAAVVAALLSHLYRDIRPAAD